MKKIRKALTFRASSIGDCLMGKYLLENIHAAHPDARCSMLVAGKSSMARDLLAAYPWIEVIEANTRHPASLLEAFKKLYPSDATITQYSGRGTFSAASKIFARLVTRHGGLAGFTDAWPFNRFVFDRLLPFSMRRAMRLHECDALGALGIPVSLPEIRLAAKEGNSVLQTLGVAEGSYIVLNLFSGSRKRGLALVHQKEITQALVHMLAANTKIILTGALSDASVMKEMTDAAPAALSAPGLSMQELITLVAKSRAVVSLDTGVGHIAAQTGAPLVILRTCWGYNWWTKDQYPREGIAVLSHDELCVHGHVANDFPTCLGAVSPEEVVQALTKTLTSAN